LLLASLQREHRPERAFEKRLNELLKLGAEKLKAEIGFGIAKAHAGRLLTSDSKLPPSHAFVILECYGTLRLFDVWTQ
jgi:hypothetical protein